MLKRFFDLFKRRVSKSGRVHLRITDCYNVHKWPETDALLSQFGIEKKDYFQGFTIYLSGPEEVALVGLNSEYGPARSTMLTGFLFYKLPEFKAFCERLGIAWTMPTWSMTIEVPSEGETVRIKHVYLGQDLGDQ